MKTKKLSDVAKSEINNEEISAPLASWPQALAPPIPLCRLVRPGFEPMAVFPIDTATTD